MRPYQLSDELEKFLHDQSSVGAAAWNKLFDETMAGLTFTPEGEGELPLEATLNLLTDQDRPRREAAARELARVFGENVKLFARVHNTLAKEKEIEDRWRKMPTPADRPAPVEPRRAGGGRGAARRGGRRLPEALAPLLRAQAQVAGARHARGLGPQRAAADGRHPGGRLGRGARHRARRLCRASIRRWPRSPSRSSTRGWIDAGREARQGPRRLRPSRR